MRLLFSLLFAFLVFLLAALPLGQTVVHGLNPAAWPPEAMTPGAWLSLFAEFRMAAIHRHIVLLASSQHPAFAGGGGFAFWLPFFVLFAVALVFALPRRDPNWRNPLALLGGARFATAAETARMSRGLEIGYGEGSQQIVRVQVEGNLLSIAPPRSGKTSGLIINNLLVPDAKLSWSGPAVVIDPKGEVFRAVGKRRHKLGHKIFVIDMRPGHTKSHYWNPLAGADPEDALGLMRAARALIPEMTGESLYFRERAVSLLAGIFVAALLEAHREKRIATPGDIERLLNDEEEALALAAGSELPLLRSLASDLRLDERIRGSIISTAKLGTQWLLDRHLRDLTSRSSIDITEIARGRADLFVIVPTEHFQTVAPLLRWLLSDLFMAVRRQRQPDDKRLLVFIDEAASLGGFDQLPVALGELPGLGASLWTFWQGRSQIVQNYGEAGADLFGVTAEFSTFSDVGGLETASPEFFSKLLGDTTLDVPGTAEQKGEGRTSTTNSAGKQAVRLVPPGDMTQMTEDRLILVANSRHYLRRPVRLEKVRYFEETRFKTLAGNVRPAARSS